MKQVIQSYRTGELAVVDVPAPRCSDRGILVRTVASVISIGTERMIVDVAKKSLLGKARERPDLVRKVFDKVKREGVWAALDAVQAKLDTPIPLGYSCAGIVEEVGRDAHRFRPGDRVACAGAGYANHAELNFVPSNLAVRVPEAVKLEEAAFVTVASVALQGVRLAVPTLGESVAVIGLGLLGQLAVPMLKANGCRVLAIDIDPAKVATAKERGADAGSVRNGDDVVGDALRFTAGRGVDAVLITAGGSSSDPLVVAGEISRDRGRVVVVGAVPLELPRKDYFERELTVLLSRSYGPGRYDGRYEEQGVDYPIGYVRWTETRNLEAVLELIASQRLPVADLISRRFAIGSAEDAYRFISGPDGRAAMGIVLEYPEASARATVRLSHTPTAKGSGSIGIGVIGAGAFGGAVLLPRLAEHKQLRPIAICSSRGFSARHMAEKFGFERVDNGADDILRDPRVEAVAILTRHDSHAALTARALEAGKHVFVEKPLALDVTGLDAVLGAAHGSKRQLFIGYNRRHSPLARRLREFVVGAGPMQFVYRVNAGRLPPSSWIKDPVSGGGRIIGEACHFVDLMTFLCGGTPHRVTCDGLAAASDEAMFDGDDNFAANIQFSDGSIGTLVYTAMGDPTQSKERLEVFAGGKMAVLDDFRSLELISGGKRDRIRLLRQDKGHGAEIDAFASSIATGIPALSLDEIAAVTRCTFAMAGILGSDELHAAALD